MEDCEVGERFQDHEIELRNEVTHAQSLRPMSSEDVIWSEPRSQRRPWRGCRCKKKLFTRSPEEDRWEAFLSDPSGWPTVNGIPALPLFFVLRILRSRLKSARGLLSAACVKVVHCVEYGPSVTRARTMAFLNTAEFCVSVLCTRSMWKNMHQTQVEMTN